MSNYEWQKQYAKQRIESRNQETRIHRLAKSFPDVHPRRNPIAAFLRAVIGTFWRRRAYIPQLFHSEHKV